MNNNKASCQEEENCRKGGKKCQNVLQIPKKAVPLHSQFRGMAITAAHREAEFTEMTKFVGEVAELVDALL